MTKREKQKNKKTSSKDLQLRTVREREEVGYKDAEYLNLTYQALEDMSAMRGAMLFDPGQMFTCLDPRQMFTCLDLRQMFTLFGSWTNVYLFGPWAK